MLLSKVANLVLAPAKGLWSIFKEIAAKVDEELYDTEKLHRELLELRMQYELEEIDTEELAAREAGILERLRLAQERLEAAEQEEEEES